MIKPQNLSIFQMQNWRNKVMEGKNFLRTYTMKCGAMGGGFEIGNRSSPTETALHISFSVEKSDA